MDMTAFWGYATCGTLICAVLAPFMGTLGDFKGMKKRLFTFFMLLGVISSALLAFTGKWKALLALYVLGTLGFNGSCVYYDSFLLDVTIEERMDRVSTLGYGLGYIGGSTIPLVLPLLLIQFGDALGIGTMLATRISFLLTAGWWLVFTLLMLRHVHQKHGIEPERNIVLHTLRNVKYLRHDSQNKSVVFYHRVFFYIDGVGTIIHMATVFGDSCGLGSMDMMVVLLVVQIVAFPFAILYGKLAEKFGSRTMILTGIATYIVVCFVAFRLSTLRDFLILAVLVGTAQGGIQALSRARSLANWCRRNPPASISAFSMCSVNSPPSSALRCSALSRRRQAFPLRHSAGARHVHPWRGDYGVRRAEEYSADSLIAIKSA